MSGNSVEASSSPGQLLSALRQVQDLVANRNHPEDALQVSTDLLRTVARALEGSPRVEEEAGATQWDPRSREPSPLAPPFRIDRSADDIIVGRVTFTPYYHGGGGAVHGGAIPLVFDQVLGRLTNAGGRTRARTAYLRVNYRRITPIGRELEVDATVDGEEGRKIFASARLRDGEDLLADAEGLYIRLRPEQP